MRDANYESSACRGVSYNVAFYVLSGRSVRAVLYCRHLKLRHIVSIRKTMPVDPVTSVPTTKPAPTLGLTGLTMNAMALIAPGAFLWLTFQQQSLYGAPVAGMSMWFGIVLALLLCLATAYSYAELSKIYPGAGSSYLYAEQAFASKTSAFKFARIAKFFTGWASHLYYWGVPRPHGRRHRYSQRIHPFTGLPRHVQRLIQQLAVHDPFLYRLRARGCLHRLSRSFGHDRSQHGDQRGADRRAAGVHRHRDFLSHEAPTGFRRLAPFQRCRRAIPGGHDACA